MADLLMEKAKEFSGCLGDALKKVADEFYDFHEVYLDDLEYDARNEKTIVEVDRDGDYL
jgi:hypothetical protein